MLPIFGNSSATIGKNEQISTSLLA